VRTCRCTGGIACPRLAASLRHRWTSRQAKLSTVTARYRPLSPLISRRRESRRCRAPCINDSARTRSCTVRAFVVMEIEPASRSWRRREAVSRARVALRQVSPPAVGRRSSHRPTGLEAAMQFRIARPISLRSPVIPSKPQLKAVPHAILPDRKCHVV
jgi:hypothetical protein